MATPDPAAISRVPYKQAGLFQTLGATHENLELLNANIRMWEDRIEALEEGGATTFTYQYKLKLNSTSVPTKRGELRFDNLDYTLATKMFIFEVDDNNVDRSIFLNIVSAGDKFILIAKADSSKISVLTVGTVTDQGDHVEYSVTDIVRDGDLFGNTEAVSVTQVLVS